MVNMMYFYSIYKKIGSGIVNNKGFALALCSLLGCLFQCLDDYFFNTRFHRISSENRTLGEK
jgi:hypothetical protein